MHGIISLRLLMQKSSCVPGNSDFRNVATLNPYNEMCMVVWGHPSSYTPENRKVKKFALGHSASK